MTKTNHTCDWFVYQIAEGKEERGQPGPQPAGTNIKVLKWDDELAKVATVSKHWTTEYKLTIVAQLTF